MASVECATSLGEEQPPMSTGQEHWPGPSAALTPPSPASCLVQTAGRATKWCSNASTAGNETPRSSDNSGSFQAMGSAPSCEGVPSPLQSPRSLEGGEGRRPSKSACEEEAKPELETSVLDGPGTERAAWELRVRRSFLEFRPPQPAVRRAVSLPDCHRHQADTDEARYADFCTDYVATLVVGCPSDHKVAEAGATQPTQQGVTRLAPPTSQGEDEKPRAVRLVSRDWADAEDDAGMPAAVHPCHNKMPQPAAGRGGGAGGGGTARQRGGGGRGEGGAMRRRGKSDPMSVLQQIVMVVPPTSRPPPPPAAPPVLSTTAASSVAVEAQAVVVLPPSPAGRGGKGRRSQVHLDPGSERPAGILAEVRRATFEGRCGQVWELACRDCESSLAVQKAMDILSSGLHASTREGDWNTYEQVLRDAQAMLGDLSGHVREALKHPHANHVMKHALETLPTELVGFVPFELVGHAVATSKHAFGCRAVLRIIPHCGKGSWASGCADVVMEEVLDKVGELSRDEFGQYVVEALLQHGSSTQRHRVAAAMVGPRLAEMAKHKHASRLLGLVFQMCEWEDTRCIVGGLLACPETVRELLWDKYGVHVLQDVARLGPMFPEIQGVLMPFAQEFLNTRHGRKMMGLLFPDRFQ
mmetsp:Transcript_5713/g.21657  ORF Transcript_5713/g.21657 Transcript_5713/m.21657 type:complete len:640 (-) Transcript_5713:241-2160(-)